MGDILDEIQQTIFAHSINDEPFLSLSQDFISEEDEWTLPELDISLLTI